MSFTNDLFKAARLSATARAVASGDPKRIARRAKNTAVGRALGRAGVWRKLWKWCPLHSSRGKRKTPRSYERGGGYAFSYRVNGTQRWESCRTLEEAKRAKSARQTDIGRGESEDRSRVTFHESAGEWVERYQERGARRGLRASTRDDIAGCSTSTRSSTCPSAPS